MSNNATRNDNDAGVDVETMFRDRKPAVQQGYIDKPGGNSRAVPGDEDAPWSKEPPFPTPPNALVEGLVPTLASAQGADYNALPEVQCERWRLIQLYFTYTMAVGGQLSIIAEVRPRGRSEWYAESLVAPVVTVITPVSTRFGFGGFGSRNLDLTELRTEVFAAGTARWSVAFDVTSNDAFRLNVQELTVNAGNTLDVFYALAL